MFIPLVIESIWNEWAGNCSSFQAFKSIQLRLEATVELP